jgi:hypothetical protein
MKKSLLVKLAFLFLIATSVSGCLWVAEDDGYGRGGGRGSGGGDHGDHRGEGGHDRH